MHMIRPCAVTAAGYQFFDDASVQRVRFLSAATQTGVPLADVARLLASIDRGEAKQIPLTLRDPRRNPLDSVLNYGSTVSPATKMPEQRFMLFRPD